MLDRDSNGELLQERQVDDGQGGKRGMKLADFAHHRDAQLAKLSEAQVLAMRLYTTAVYKSINDPLRDRQRHQKNEPHPMPVLVHQLDKAIRKLRAVEAHGATKSASIDLYRGLRNKQVQNKAPLPLGSGALFSAHKPTAFLVWQVPAAFLPGGGAEFGPMSTTHSLAVAMQYAASDASVIFRLRTDNCVMRGADVRFLSAFPHERECLFPPLTYLTPIVVNDVPVTQTVKVGHVTFEVVDVKPHF